jgi:hypothetical protein
MNAVSKGQLSLVTLKLHTLIAFIIQKLVYIQLGRRDKCRRLLEDLFLSINNRKQILPISINSYHKFHFNIFL